MLPLKLADLTLLCKGSRSPRLLLIPSERASCKHILHVIVLTRLVLVGLYEMVDVRLWRISNPTIIILLLSFMQAV